MRVEPVAQVPHDPLPDPGGLVGLQDADGAVDDRDDGHDGDQDDEQLKVGATGDEQGLVEHRLDEQRVDDADCRGHHDQSDDGGHLGPIGAEQRRYPAGGVPVHVGWRGRAPADGPGQRPRDCHVTRQRAGCVPGSTSAPAHNFTFGLRSLIHPNPCACWPSPASGVLDRCGMRSNPLASTTFSASAQ